MSNVREWTEALAIVVAPDEQDLASFIVDAYRGEQASRDQLFKSPSSDPAVTGFGAGDVAMVLPPVLAAVVAVSAQLLPLLQTALPLAGDAISVSDAAARLRERLDQAETAVPPDVSANPSEIDGVPRVSLIAVTDAMREALQEHQIPRERSELIAWRVVQLLLLDPPAAAEFVGELATDP